MMLQTIQRRPVIKIHELGMSHQQTKQASNLKQVSHVDDAWIA